MSTIKSSDEHLTLNADGSSKDIKFQANGVEKASLSSAGVFTATSFAGSGAALTGVGVAGITSAADATAMTITSAEHIGIGTSSPAITESRQAGKFLTVYSTATNGSILELSSNKNTDNDTVGIVSFINTENGDTSGNNRKYLAQIRGKVETNDSNAQDDSGGNLVFQTKADGGVLDDRLTITSDGRGLSQFTAKAWSTHNQHGTLAVGDSHNVSSITDIGTGNFRLNFSNNMGGTNYTWTGFCTYWGGSYNDATSLEQDSNDANNSNGQNNNNLTLHTMSSLNGLTTWQINDMQVVNVVVFGD